MKRFTQFVAAVTLFTFLLFGVFAQGAFAQSTGLRINPRLDLQVRAGETQSGSLLVANLNKEVGTVVDLNVVDFKSSNETGASSPILEEGAEMTPYSLKQFITLPESVELGPGETKYVAFSVRIPEGQGAGSYYSAIKYDPRPENGEDNVLVSGAPMQLIFVTVPGRATELMNLKRFGAYTHKENEVDGSYASIFIASQPSRLAYLLQNSGNVAENPRGSILIKNIFGKEVTTIPNANPKQSLALIDQTRRFEVCIKPDVEQIQQDGRTADFTKCANPDLKPGIYTAELNLLYGINGSNEQEITATTTFWYLPPWSIAVGLAVLAVLAYAILKVRNALIGSKRHSRRR